MTAKSAFPHPQENERLRELRELGLLDTAAEQPFLDLVALAAKLTKSPIALISLVDESRQWFKASIGLATNETPRSVSFCAHAILQNDVFSVPDATKDIRFHDNPLTTGEPHVVAYHGAPLYGPGGLPIGTLCVVASHFVLVPRGLDFSRWVGPVGQIIVVI